MNKLQSGDLKDQQLTFDLTEILRELNQIYDERAAKKGIRYEIDWKNGIYSHSTLVGNPVYLGRIPGKKEMLLCRVSAGKDQSDPG